MRTIAHQVRVDPKFVHAVGDPSKLALIVVDMQNLFLAAPSEWSGLDDGDNGSFVLGVVPAINALIDAVHASHGLVVFTRQTASDDPGAVFPAWFKELLGPGRGPAMDSLRPGTAGHEVSPLLHASPEDLFIDKFRSSAFLPDTAGLHKALCDRGIDTVIITGTVTNHCCQATARDAYLLDYRVLFPIDATAGLDDDSYNATLADLNNVGFFDLRFARDIVDELAMSQSGQTEFAGS